MNSLPHINTIPEGQTRPHSELQKIDGVLRAQELFLMTEIGNETPLEDVLATIRDRLADMHDDNFKAESKQLSKLLENTDFDRNQVYELLNVLSMSDLYHPLTVVLKDRLGYTINDDKMLKSNLDKLRDAISSEDENYDQYMELITKLIAYSESEIGKGELDSDLHVQFNSLIKNFTDSTAVLAQEIQEYLYRSTMDDAEKITDVYEPMYTEDGMLQKMINDTVNHIGNMANGNHDDNDDQDDDDDHKTIAINSDMLETLKAMGFSVTFDATE